MARISKGRQSVGRANIHKNGRYWHVQYTGLDGKNVRYSLKVTNKEIAERKARKISDMLEAGDDVALYHQAKSSEQRIPLSTFLDIFEKEFTGWRESTWRGNRSRLNIIKEALGDYPLDSITHQHISSFLREKCDVKISNKYREYTFTPASQNRYLATLKTLFKMAVEWDYIYRSPADRVKMIKEQQIPPKGLTGQEFEELLGKIDHEYVWQVVAWAADTGMRRSQIAALRKEHINLRRGEIRVFSQTKTGEYRILPVAQGDPEWVRGNPARPLCERVWHLLQQLCEDRKEKDPLFPDLLLHYTLVRKHLQAAANEVGLGHTTFHHLRHTFATRALDLRVPLRDVQELMGHKSPIMTERYDNARPERVRRTIDALVE